MIKVQSSLTAPKDSPGLSSGMGFLSSGKGVQEYHGGNCSYFT